MKYSSESLERVIDLFATLPSIGRKTAQRLAFYVLKQDLDYAERFAQSLLEMKQSIMLCSVCFNYTENNPCSICTSNNRNRNQVCIVEEPNDVIAIEKTNEYKGLYHVLHGCLNPIEGINPDDIKIKELMPRLVEIDEVILALNPSMQGEATSLYISRFLKPMNISITKIASGIPLGSSLEFTDEATLARAMEMRVKF